MRCFSETDNVRSLRLDVGDECERKGVWLWLITLFVDEGTAVVVFVVGAGAGADGGCDLDDTLALAP